MNEDSRQEERIRRCFLEAFVPKRHRVGNQTPTDRDRHRCVVDVLEFRTVSSIGPSDVMAVSGSVDPLADPG